MGRSGWILGGLAAGLLLGGLGAAAAPGAAADAAAALAPVGKIWLDALKMTVLPLVFALLVTGVAGAASAAEAGGVALRTMVTILFILVLCALLSLALSIAALDLLPPGEAGLAALRAGTHAGSVPPPPPLAEFLTSIVPANVVKAAAEGAMLSIVVFGLFFGFAVTRIAPERRALLLGFFEALAETMLVIVGWVLWAAPLGVFALAFGLTATTGAAALGGLAYYLALTCAVGLAVTLAGYPLAVLAGGVAPGRFARACLPAQVVAVSTQSSLAAMPAMLEGARGVLGVPPAVAGTVLPMAVALLRATSPAVNLAIALFTARVYGIELGAAQIAAGTAVAVLVSLSTISLPSSITFFTASAPIALAMGLPLELLAILVAVETIPDIFRTLGNVTMDLAATAIVAKRSSGGTTG